MADKEYVYEKYGIPLTSSGNITEVRSSYNTARHSGPTNQRIRARSEHRKEVTDVGLGRIPQLLRTKPFGSHTDLRDPRTAGIAHSASRNNGSQQMQQKGHNEGGIRLNRFLDRRQLHPHSAAQTSATSSIQTNPVRHGRRGIQPVDDNKISDALDFNFRGGILTHPKRANSQSSSFNIGRESQRNTWREPAREQLHERKPTMEATKTRTRRDLTQSNLLHDSQNTVRSGKPESRRTYDPKSAQGFQAQDAKRGFQGERKLDYRSLREISLLEPSEIIMKLAAPRSGFSEVLSRSDMPCSLMELMLEVLNKAIGCRSSRQNLLHLLGNVQSSAFIKQTLPYYLLGADKMQQEEQLQGMLPVISYILALLLELISIFPSSCAMETSLVETLLQKAVSQMCSKGIAIPDATTKNLTNLHTFLQHLQEKKREGTLRSDNYTYLQGNEDSSSTSDFRQMSTFPTHDDIFLKQNPVMRPNIVSQVYSDANAYLDTHFRLLREDFIRPLRDGISQLLGLQGKELMRATFDDIRVYVNAVIIMSVCTHAGIVNQVQFSIKNLKGIRWESSKRLLFGALVCLSKDNFETMLFATVADRNVKELEKGIITLKFTDESRLSLVQMKSDDAFLMVETNAYFEAYRHVLEGLKEMGGSEIPLQKYIVHCEADVQAPAYLTQNRAEYTLKTLVTDESLALKQIPHSNSSDEDSSSEDDSRKCKQSIKSCEEETELSTLMERLLGNLYTKKDTQGLSSSTARQPGTRFDVLDFKTWPSKESLKLDRSQLKAFQMALTKELTIIQGPPGTGKTYVGMKIVKALLANSKVWSPREHRPILVVCYTNHALDQFLEGIHAFVHSGIVRVGSRSNSEMMKNCSLSSLLKYMHLKNSIPGHLRALYAELKNARSVIESEICYKVAALKAALNELLPESILEQYISDKHLKILQSVKDYPQTCLEPNFSVILEWLAISVLCKNKKQPVRSCAYYEQSANAETLLSQIDQLEKNIDCTESSIFDGEEDRDLIKVAEEAELVQTERMMENDDIKNQILEAHATVAREHAKIRDTLPQLHLDDDDKDDKDVAGSSEAGPWEITKEMKKKLKHLIKRELQKTHHMDEEISEKIDDLWQLPFPQRWELYRLWRAKYLTNIRCKITTFENEYQLIISRMNELRNQEELLIMRKAWIIGMTTTGAAKYRKVLQDIRPKIIIVEEAAEVLEAHILTTLSSECEHLILIGDHQQLRPSATVYELAKNFNLEVSMFERLVKMNVQYVRLDYQHRMRPEIAQLLTPHIYEQLENHSSVYKYDNIKGVSSNLFFVEHENHEEQIQEGKSHKNVHEATFVVSLCRYFICQGYEPSQITVLTTYSGQLFCLKSLMPKAIFDGVRVCVVDKYQGEENEIVILSLVRSNLEGRVGFLQIPNRICVALSRAKRGLFCIGNMQMLSQVPLWQNIIDVLSSKELIGRELKLCCENHPNTLSYVSKAEDFSKVPEGGCMVPCEYRLACGHVCTLACHPYDAEHKKFRCGKPCQKTTCEMGHKCRKLCYQVCGPCRELVKKEIPRCGHIQDVQCSEEPSRFVCQEPCTKILACGHSCVRSCGDSCTRNCPELMTVELECGHSTAVMCHVKMKAECSGEKIPCFAKCPAMLECGHRCLGSCSKCLQGKSHVACKAECDHILICTHRCIDRCSANCTCCLLACENKCFHGKCDAKCSDPCPPCTKPCGWKCKHRACTKLCWELCDREPCDMPCSKELKCGHPCIGMCGEPCPQKCRVCNTEEVTELFFGNEANPESRFVQLRGCSHIFEVSECTKWMNQKEDKYIIRLKSCPKCLIPIRHNLRYGSVVRETLSDIETVKRKIVQAWVSNLQEFLSEKEELLKYFPCISKIEQDLKDSQSTIRSILLIAEKLNYLFKLGCMKKKTRELPHRYQLIVGNKIKEIYKQIEEATSITDILMQQNAVFRAALLAESLWVTKSLLSGASDLSASKINDLISKLQHTKLIGRAELQDIHEKMKDLSPFLLELVALVLDRTAILDTKLLRQDQWRKCCDGHIYSSQKTSLCPQCNVNNEVDIE